MTEPGQGALAAGAWRVDIDTRGRGGVIRYRERDCCIAFDWEFGAGAVVAIVRGPAPDAWDTLHPWAAGRRAEITMRVAGDTIRQKAPTCTADIDERSGVVHLVAG